MGKRTVDRSVVAAGASDGDQSKPSREEVGVGLRSQVCLG